VREQPKAAPEPVKEIAPPPPIAKLDSPPVSVPAPPPAPKPQVRTDVFGGATKGLEVVTSKTSRIVAPAGGFDRVGTSTQGARETRVVADSAFGDARGDAPAGGKPGARGTVQAGGFDTGAVKVGTRPQRERPLAALDTGVEILSKPKPVYTEEARGLRIEGDVVLEVTFLASAQVLVLGVVEGLGHGLDQAAIEAAKKIRFTPARRSGQAVDHTATLRVVFRLA